MRRAPLPKRRRNPSFRPPARRGQYLAVTAIDHAARIPRRQRFSDPLLLQTHACSAAARLFLVASRLRAGPVGALGWLVSLAGKDSPAARILSSRASRGRLKTPGDLRAIWNWFYLCIIREDHAGAFEAAAKLSEAAHTILCALWAFLNAIGPRDTPLGQRYGLRALSQIRQADEIP